MRRTSPAALLAATASPAGVPGAAHAAVAPGRVAFPAGPPEPDVDAAGAVSGAALPDGGAVLVSGRDYGHGIVLARLLPGGAPDPSFGRGGIVRLVPPVAPFHVQRILLRPGGLLLVGDGPAASRYETDQLVLLGLTPQGALDPSFGRGGVAAPGIQGSRGAAVAADGSILVTGSTGSVSPAVEHDPNAPNTFAPAVARLTPTGALDPAFGRGGVETVPGIASGDGVGFFVAGLPDGRVEVLAESGRRAVLARLLPDGSADPGFAAGHPLPLPLLDPAGLALRPDGSAYVLGTGGLARVTPAGALDGSFGSSGVVTVAATPFGSALLGAGDGALVYGAETLQARPASAPVLHVDAVGGDGTVAHHDVRVAFGGGIASFARAYHRYLPVPSLAQNAFVTSELLPRPGGSLLAVGTIAVAQYAGEGVGRSGGLFAAAALTPAFHLDRSYGGPAARPRIRAGVVRERPRHAYRARGVAVRLRASGAGLARITVRDARGRVLARGVEPVFRAGHSRVLVQIARSGAHELRHARRLAVRVEVRFRDVFVHTARTRAHGVLR